MQQPTASQTTVKLQEKKSLAKYVVPPGATSSTTYQAPPQQHQGYTAAFTSTPIQTGAAPIQTTNARMYGWEKWNFYENDDTLYTQLALSHGVEDN